ncbi:MAG: hypothetical protein IPN33_26140 [Saprospiraceae bacterium]|nr:hypothetical protein [Saprospiraceae bacterium]
MQIESGKASLAALALATVFSSAGEALIRHVASMCSHLRWRGSRVLFLIGMEMMLGIRIFRDSAAANSGSVVPVAFPLIAGAGAPNDDHFTKAKYRVVDIQLGVVLGILFVYL